MRLNKRHKDEIVNAVLDHRFKADREAHKKNKPTMDEVWAGFFSKSQRETLLSLPKAWFKWEDSMRIMIGKESVYFESSKTFPITENINGWNIHLKTTHPTYDKAAEWMRQSRKLCDLEASARAEAQAVVNACSSLKALREAWPEITSILDGLYGSGVENKKMALSIDMKKLNKSLDLPPEGADA